jgi:hypothetical protein
VTSIAVDEKDQKVRRAHCANCKDERNCSVEAKVEQRGGDDDFQWHTDWYVLKCRGCDHVFVQTVSSNSEDYDNYYEYNGSTGATYNETISYFPSLTKRSKPEWLFQYSLMENPKGLGLGSVLEQVYGALDNDLPTLAAIGMRTAFDLAAVQLGGKAEDSFNRKIEGLVSSSKLREKDKEMIAALVDAGSASVHRGWTPSQKELELMIEILESFIEENFIVPEKKRLLEEKSRKLRQTVPSRQKTK